MKNVAAIILAAGKGKRMKSDLPKVLHQVLGRPMVEYLLDTIIPLSFNRIVLVVGHQAELVKKTLGKYEGQIDFVLQKKQLGTGHAVLMSEPALKGFSGDILVMLGDVPFLPIATIQRLIAVHRQEKAAGTVLSVILPDPAGYGRIVRAGSSNRIDRIVEDRDASEQEKQIKEINTGMFCFDSKLIFAALGKITADNSQGEYYLTDVMAILRRQGHTTAVCLTDNSDEALGINSAEQLADLENRFAKRY